MKWLAALLLIQAPQDDKAAETLLGELRQKIRAAKALRVEYTLDIGAGAAVQERTRGAILLKGTSLWKNDLDFDSRNAERNIHMSLVSDGRKVASMIPSLRTRFHALTPEQNGALLRSCLEANLIPLYFYSEPRFWGRGGEGLGEPSFGPIKDDGREKDVRIVATELSYPTGPLGREKMRLRFFIDPETKRLLKRELNFGGVLLTETFSVFAIDEEVPDSEFSIQSGRRLARARAEQAARSVELFARFTGRNPASFDDLARRPASLEADVFFPEGGFLATAPKDPWGRPFGLRQEGLKLIVSSLGADGKAGGKGDDEDVEVPVPAGNRQAVGAPTDRLKQQFTARVQVQLLAAAVRGFLSAYGELPTKKAALWERPEWAKVWPEGGWLPGPALPADPWGEPYRIISEAESVRVQTSDPKARLLGTKQLTPEERRALEETAKPRLAAEERTEIARLIEELGQDDLETRERAEGRLKAFSLAAVATLEERLKKEPDAEVRARLGEIRRSIKVPRAAWMGELAPLAVTVLPGEGWPLPAGQTSSNERNASACLKTIATAQADFRANDRDGNKVQDFWTGDIAGLYCIYTQGDPKRQGNKLIELSVAAADAAPLDAGAAGGIHLGIDGFAVRAPKAGYHFRSMTQDNSSAPPESYLQDTGGTGNMGKVLNSSKFGACAYPADYPVSGTMTYILNEGNTLFAKDTEGEPVLEWPSDEDLKTGWRKLD